MAKLSKYFLKTLLLPFCKASEQYETVSCINDQNVSYQMDPKWTEMGLKAYES